MGATLIRYSQCIVRYPATDRHDQEFVQVFPAEEQRRACQLLSEVGLEEKHLYRRASDLSGGQQQRVAIARAFMSTPEIVLADEPVASLDPTMSRSVLNSLKTAAKQHGATVVCTLHQVDYAIEFADRIVALRKGKVFFDGHPKDMDTSIQEQLYRLTEDTVASPKPAICSGKAKQEPVAA